MSNDIDLSEYDAFGMHVIEFNHKPNAAYLKSLTKLWHDNGFVIISNKYVNGKYIINLRKENNEYRNNEKK